MDRTLEGLHNDSMGNRSVVAVAPYSLPDEENRRYCSQALEAGCTRPAGP